MAKLINELLLLSCMGAFIASATYAVTWSAPELRISGSCSRFWLRRSHRAADIACGHVWPGAGMGCRRVFLHHTGAPA
jgi:hypothetical protein